MRFGPAAVSVAFGQKAAGLLAPEGNTPYGSDAGSPGYGEMAPTLDVTDWLILKALQANGRITNVDLAAQVGLSPPPCLRRVRALENAGVIRGYFAMLDEAMTGFEVTAFAMVGLHNQADADLRTFENRLLKWPIVREAHMLSGEADYMLKCVAPTLAGFQSFVLQDLNAAPNVASVKTTLALRRAKFEPGVALHLVRRDG
jgi:DNA-binding Lrp family transcriptional regulator